MTYYVAEIRFNRENKNLKKDRRMRKRLTLRLITLLLISLLFSASIVIISVAACQNKPVRCSCGDDDHEDKDNYNNCDDNWWHCRPDWGRCKSNWWCCKPGWWHCRPSGLVISSLKRLRNLVSRLPEEAFKDPENAGEQKETLRNMICTVIGLIKDGKYQQALSKLEEIKDVIREWISHCWQTYLIKRVNCIICLIKWIFCGGCKPPCTDRKPPTIVTVLRYPETPNYDEAVTVIAQVIDKQSGVKSVILSYQVDSSDWTNTTMSIIDGLYAAEIPPLPYNSTVNYKVYAYDCAGNPATPETDSYVVADFYSPEISYVDRFPASPNYNDNVTVFANVTEPPEASGVKNVTLWYRTEDDWQPVEMTLDQLYTGPIPAFPYGTVVQYRIRAFDYANNWAASGVYSYTVGAPPNLPPVAKFTESAETVYTGEVISFNASESYDPDGNIISYFWDFGDGTNATDVLLAEHAYAEDGNYAVILTVTDNDGSTDIAISTKEVLNRPPVASFTEDATTVLTGEAIHFDASGSNDPDGHVMAYIWNFSDGTSASGVSVSHAYEDNGAYTVTLAVIDNDGATSSYSAVETVLNRVPVAQLAKNATTVKENEAIHFDASESYDLDGSIVSYFWDFGDGTNSTDVAVDYAYAEDGNYTVTLTVTDDDGAYNSVSTTITVEAPAPFPLALLAAIGLGIAALTATLLYALYRKRKKGGSAANPGDKPKPVVTLYVPAKILSRFQVKPLKRRSS